MPPLGPTRRAAAVRARRGDRSGVPGMVRVLAQARHHKLHDIAWNFVRYCQELGNDVRRNERAVAYQDRRLLDDAGALAVVDPLMHETLSGLPANRVLVPVLAVGKLERDRHAVVVEPDPQVLLVREEAPAPRLAGNLPYVGNLAEHQPDECRRALETRADTRRLSPVGTSSESELSLIGVEVFIEPKIPTPICSDDLPCLGRIR